MTAKTSKLIKIVLCVNINVVVILVFVFVLQCVPNKIFISFQVTVICYSLKHAYVYPI